MHNFSMKGRLQTSEFTPEDKPGVVYRSFKVPVMGGILKADVGDNLSLFAAGKKLEGQEVVVRGRIEATAKGVKLVAEEVVAAK